MSEGDSLINTSTPDIKSWIVDVQDKLKSDQTFAFGLQTSVDTQRKIKELWLSDSDSVVKYICPLTSLPMPKIPLHLILSR